MKIHPRDCNRLELSTDQHEGANQFCGNLKMQAVFAGLNFDPAFILNWAWEQGVIPIWQNEQRATVCGAVEVARYWDDIRLSAMLFPLLVTPFKVIMTGRTSQQTRSKIIVKAD